MLKIVKIFPFIFFSLFFVLRQSVNAASFTNAKDTISTSRPSASTPLDADLSIGATQATIIDNGSRFIASDSAKLIGGTSETITVASMSAANTPGVGQRIVYFPTAVTNAHAKGSVIMVPITAKHTISFNATNAIPASGQIVVAFPVGDTSNQASPSATGFSFNNLSGSSNLSISGGTCSSWSVSAAGGTVTCNVQSTIEAGTEVVITIGSSVPVLINPTKTASAGTADAWTITITSKDSSGVEIDKSKIRIGTIDSVEVYATVDPYINFSIAGRSAGAAVNTGNTTGCTNTETINTGFDSTATSVNLGVLGDGQVNISAQLLTISTNAVGGYVLTATSSGHLIDPAVGYWLADAQGDPTNNNTPSPAPIVAGTTAFGIHPCGLDVPTSSPDWAEGANQTCTTGGGTDCYYANPSSTYYYTLASDSSGPISNSLTAGNGLVTVEYAATIAATVPAGNYRTTITYVATATF